MSAVFTESNYATYKAVRALADLVFAEFHKAGGSTNAGASAAAWLEDRRYQSVNPFYNQMASGLVLELYYGLPAQIHTPWGEWAITGSGSSSGDWFWFDRLVETIAKQTDATLAQAERIDDMGHHGPWFAIGCVGDYKCGPSVTRKPSDYLTYEAARDAWEAMTARYKEERP